MTVTPTIPLPSSACVTSSVLIWKMVQQQICAWNIEQGLCKGGCCSLSAQRFPLLIQAPQKVREGERWRQRERRRYVGVPGALQSHKNTSVCHRHFTHTVRSHNSYTTFTAEMKSCFECNEVQGYSCWKALTVFVWKADLTDTRCTVSF